MYSTESLSVEGFRGRRLQNTFFRQEEETNHLAVAFPGYGYRCYGPVIYYPSLALLSLGADVMWVEYAYDLEPDYQSIQPDERREWRLTDASSAIKAALERRSYERFTLIGKSIGTLVLGEVLTADPRMSAAKAIWLTPLFKNERLRVQLNQLKNRSLFVSGTADSEYDAEFAAKLGNKPGAKLVLLEGADHSLEVRGDAIRSLERLKRLTEQTLNFLKE